MHVKTISRINQPRPFKGIIDISVFTDRDIRVIIIPVRMERYKYKKEDRLNIVSQFLKLKYQKITNT